MKHLRPQHLIAATVFTILSTGSFARETKLEKARNKNAFWGVLADNAMIRVNCNKTPPNCTDQTKTRLDHVQKHFSAIDQRFPSQPDLQKILDQMSTALIQPNNAETMRKLSWQFERRLLKELDALPMPTETIDYKMGQDLFEEHCTSCHGATGENDGSLSSKLQITPQRWGERTRRKTTSPLATYAVMVHGLEGSEMPSFLDGLSQDEMWNVAFFVAQLPYRDLDLSNCSDVAIPPLDLLTLMTASDEELAATVSASATCPEPIAVIRRRVTYDRTTPRETLNEIAPQGSRSARGLIVMGLSVALVSAGFIWILRARGRVK